MIAHRCGGVLAPENTLAGFDMCARYGYRMVEFDAKLSADDEIFLLHDDTLERTTNGHGAAALRSWRELSMLDAGAWYGAGFIGQRLPTLSDVAHRCIGDAIAANIEIKPCPGRDVRTGEHVAKAALTLWRSDLASASAMPPLLSSFSVEALAAARDVAPLLPRGILFDAVPDDWRPIARGLECISLHANHRHLSADRVARIRAEGLRVLAYTVNDPARARELLKWGVDMICTDRLDLIAANESGV